MSSPYPFSRRSLLAGSGSIALTPAWLAASAQQQGAERSPTIQLPPFKSETEQQSGPPPVPKAPEERLGICVVGLGNLSVDQILPAIAHSRSIRLAGLMSGTPDKAGTLAKQYGLSPSSVYGYDDYGKLAADEKIQAVYVVLPNGLHRDHVIRAFEAGKHVLCEKPMANTSKECEEMIAAGRKAQKKLMVAYRIQYEPKNRYLREQVRSGKFGPVKLIESANVQRQGAADQWRHKRSLAGGGCLPDIGLYCLNTTRFVSGEEPSEVFASLYSTPGDPRFREVEENIVVQMKFPSGLLSTFTSGYDSHESRRYRVHCPTGWFGLGPAFSYSGLRMEQSHAEGKLEIRSQLGLVEKNQFALEMDHFADCVARDRKPFTPGEEGLQDHRIMEAIYLSAKTNKSVALAKGSRKDEFRGPEPETMS